MPVVLPVEVTMPDLTKRQQIRNQSLINVSNVIIRLTNYFNVGHVICGFVVHVRMSQLVWWYSSVYSYKSLHWFCNTCELAVVPKLSNLNSTSTIPPNLLDNIDKK